MTRAVSLLLIFALSVPAALAQDALISPIRPLAMNPGEGQLQAPAPDPALRVLPINLATALHLAGGRPIDVALAGERVRYAAAALDQAWAVWLPTVTVGGDYNRHDGRIQDVEGRILTTSRS